MFDGLNRDLDLQPRKVRKIWRPTEIDESLFLEGPSQATIGPIDYSASNPVGPIDYSGAKSIKMRLGGIKFDATVTFSGRAK